MARPNVLVIDTQRDMHLYAMLTRLELEWAIRTTETTQVGLDLITSSNATQGTWWQPEGIILGSSLDDADCAYFIESVSRQPRTRLVPIIRLTTTPPAEPTYDKLTSVRHFRIPHNFDSWKAFLHTLDGLFRRASQSSGAVRLDRLLGRIPA